MAHYAHTLVPTELQTLILPSSDPKASPCPPLESSFSSFSSASSSSSEAYTPSDSSSPFTYPLHTRDAPPVLDLDYAEDPLAFGLEVIEREARALALAAARLRRRGKEADGFRRAVELIVRATGPGRRGRGKVVVTGVGKSGIIARKLTATFLSLGTPSFYLSPTDALHGDLGAVTPTSDIILALSYSGSTPELLSLLPHFRRRQTRLIALCRSATSALARAADVWVDGGCGDGGEAWDEVPAPTCSTTVALAVGDALAVAVTRCKGLGRETFGMHHPGGTLGKAMREDEEEEYLGAVDGERGT